MEGFVAQRRDVTDDRSIRRREDENSGTSGKPDVIYLRSIAINRDQSMHVSRDPEAISRSGM